MQELTGRGNARVRRVKRAQILWAAQQGHSDAVIAQTVEYEHRRNGTANLFVFLNAHQPRRHVKGIERKTAHDFAHCMHELVEVHYPDAETVRGMLDHLSAHKPAALYEVFAPERARNRLRRLELHFGPQHASWLNMVEDEIGVLSQQCPDRRIPDRETLQREVAHWERRRNAEGARVEWMFDVRRAREKLGRVYPSPLLSDLAQAA